MKCIDQLATELNRPRLTPKFKKAERTLLSVFMRTLELIPEVRAEFLSLCGYGAGKSCSYTSYMEVTYPSNKYPDGRPDGLISCQYGKRNWAAFIEAKAEKSPIRLDQMQEYAELASMLDVDALISLSNEFARAPSEPPYNIPNGKRRKREIYHFAWAELRTMLELQRVNDALPPVEAAILDDCLDYFWSSGSGVSAYDQMPPEWPDFVQSAGVGVGFQTQTPGITEIVKGWHQERRDIRSKLIHETHKTVELRHETGVRATPDDILKHDRKRLAEDYELAATFYLKDAKLPVSVLAGLKDRKITVSLDISPPDGKGAKASVTWFAKCATEFDCSKTSVVFDWPGHGNKVWMMLEDLKKDPEPAFQGQKKSPKRIRLTRQVHDVRRFKSRKNFVVDVEAAVLSVVRDAVSAGWT